MLSTFKIYQTDVTSTSWLGILSRMFQMYQVMWPQCPKLVIVKYILNIPQEGIKKGLKRTWAVYSECSWQCTRSCDHYIPNWDILSPFTMYRPSSTSIFLIGLFKMYLQRVLQCTELGKLKTHGWYIVNIWWKFSIFEKHSKCPKFLQCTNHVFLISQARYIVKHVVSTF